MKTTSNRKRMAQPLLAAALAAGALSARADWMVTGPADITVTPGESGTSVYQFTAPSGPPGSALITSESSSYQIEGSGINETIGPNAPITTYLAAVDPVGMTINANETFDIIVDWTISANPAFIGHEFAANFGIDTDAYGSASAAGDVFIVTAAPLPEPAQTLAGGLLLGCGALVYARKRFLKKQAQAA